MLHIPLFSHEAPFAFLAFGLMMLFILKPLKALRRSLINTSVFFFVCLMGDLLAGILLSDRNMLGAANWLREETTMIVAAKASGHHQEPEGVEPSLLCILPVWLKWSGR